MYKIPSNKRGKGCVIIPLFDKEEGGNHSVTGGIVCLKEGFPHAVGGNPE